VLCNAQLIVARYVIVVPAQELENFKSYGGIRNIGPFHKCFSAVVGPNGSGKSNVIDALLFVFGKRATKLRFKKVRELIHKNSSASAAATPPDLARVSVYFHDIIDTGDGDYDYVVVPNSEVVVTRIAKRDNSSTYLLNGKTCPFRQVADFLETKGIDLDNNRFLILQGEVEMISMMPPKAKTEHDEGLLEYLEDIIGSGKFVAETDTMAEKLEALSEVRLEKLNRVKAVEKEKDALGQAKREAEALLAKERDIRRKQNVLYQIYHAAADADQTRYKQQQANVTEQLQVQQAQFEEAGARIAEIEKSTKGQQQEYNKIYAELLKTQEEFNAFERRDIKLREEIKHASSQQKTLTKKISEEQKKHDTAVRTQEEATTSIPTLQEQIEQLGADKAKKDAALEVIQEEMKEATNSLRLELEVKTRELAPLKQEQATFQASLDTARTEVQIVEDSTRRATEKLQQAETELSQLDATQASKRQQLQDSKTEIKNCKDRLRQATQDEQRCAAQEEPLADRVRQCTARLEQAKVEHRNPGGEHRVPSAVRALIQASRRGGPLQQVGLLGRLGDLATIDAQYDVAVSTACGGKLDSVVIQTTAGAQKCLEYLRQHNLGRANFIPLDKMKHGALHDRVVETPENAPRLLELISPSHFSVTPAIFLAVADTLVAPDLDTATRWAYESSGKRWRVVTMDGKLIETSGTMSGGGTTVRKGAMRLVRNQWGPLRCHCFICLTDDL
jgi:structural maintenance of chromosome 4